MELGDYKAYVTCPRCFGSGKMYKYTTGTSLLEEVCTMCGGEKYIVNGFVDLADILDKLNDIKEKLDETKETVDEIKELVSA